MDEKYIFDDIEVKMTGRTATKELRRGKTSTLYEITPIDPDSGGWRKWVHKDILYVIDNADISKPIAPKGQIINEGGYQPTKGDTLVNPPKKQ